MAGSTRVPAQVVANPGCPPLDRHRLIDHLEGSAARSWSDDPLEALGVVRTRHLDQECDPSPGGWMIGSRWCPVSLTRRPTTSIDCE